ncbi:hypothetical protein [Tumebacillus sp. BK434]|nr:hypothetical protein [Tumebacillus sp. BK434]
MEAIGVHLAMQMSGTVLGLIGVTGLLLRGRLGKSSSLDIKKTGEQL